MSRNAAEPTMSPLIVQRCAVSWRCPAFVASLPKDAKPMRAQLSFKLGDAYDPAAEAAQDKLLEEEEFSAMQRCAEAEDPYLPLVHRLAGKADVLGLELRRMQWELRERRQLLLDTHGGSLLGRPAKARRAMARALLDKQRACSREKIKQPRAATGSDAAPAAAATKAEEEDVVLTAQDLAPYANWCGSSSGLVRLVGFFTRRFLWAFSKQPRSRPDREEAASSKELAALTQDLDYIRRVRSYHALNYYSRMILTPKRHIGHAVYIVLWNLWIGFQNSIGCFVFYTLREVKQAGWVRGTLLGSLKGGWAGLKFIAYGWVVSPCIHIPCGLCNSLYGPLNFFSGKYFFDSLSGRWMHCTVMDTLLLRHLLQREKRLIRAIGRLEFKRKHMHAEEKWARRLAAMGFSIEELGNKFMSRRERNANGKTSSTARAKKSEPNLYDVLGVKRTATQQQIKAQYKKLAMLFHPDVAQSGDPSERARRETQSKFESISNAYRILSNQEKRRAYDMGGARAIELHETQYGRFLSRTPEAMVQSIFGGEAFRRTLLGELLRSHWCLRTEAQVSVSMHQFEELLCIRVRQLALEIAGMVDVHAKGISQTAPRRGANRVKRNPATESRSKVNNIAANELRPGSNEYNNFSKDFEDRCERFVSRLSEACFGPELLYETGEAYVVSAQRFLKLRPFYTPKVLLNRKLMTGIGRIANAMLEKSTMDKEEVAKRILIEYFNMEYDNVVADAHVVLRFAVQLVLQDATQSEKVRKMRCYALWFLGNKMMERGSPWNFGQRDDGDLIAYVQQAANSSATTCKPPEF